MGIGGLARRPGLVLAACTWVASAVNSVGSPSPVSSCGRTSGSGGPSVWLMSKTCVTRKVRTARRGSSDSGVAARRASSGLASGR